MIAYFILGLCIVVGTLFLARWFANADPKQVLRVLKWILVGLGLGFLALLLFMGRHALALLLLPALLPLIAGFRRFLQRMKTMRGPSTGQTSEVATRFFRMTLNHDSGAMDGIVLEGSFKGQRLSEMELDALLDLWRDCRAEDEQSAAVLEAFLDRIHGDTWREIAGLGAAGGGASDSSSARRGQATMTREEAYDVLGLGSGASEADIRAAHRRLMRHAHPDHGGSNYLAAKINQAKDLLLGS